jgi:hypothetical protein
MITESPRPPPQPQPPVDCYTWARPTMGGKGAEDATVGAEALMNLSPRKSSGGRARQERVDNTTRGAVVWHIHACKLPVARCAAAESTGKKSNVHFAFMLIWLFLRTSV